MCEGKSTRGGKRPGAGRPKGTTQAVIRKKRSIRAFDDEWEMIKEFSRIMKKDKLAVNEFLKKHSK